MPVNSTQHPLADLKTVNGEATINSWGFASMLTEALRQQGLNGRAAIIIRAELQNGTVPIERLMENTVGGSRSSERELQVHIREAVEEKFAAAFGVQR